MLPVEADFSLLTPSDNAGDKGDTPQSRIRITNVVPIPIRVVTKRGNLFSESKSLKQRRIRSVPSIRILALLHLLIDYSGIFPCLAGNDSLGFQHVKGADNALSGSCRLNYIVHISHFRRP